MFKSFHPKARGFRARWAALIVTAGLASSAFAQPMGAAGPLATANAGAGRAPAMAGSGPDVSAGEGAPAKRAIETWLDNKARVDEVRRTPVPGLFEVRVGTEFVYVDGTGQYALIEGDLVDMRARRNLTRERSDEVLSINFEDLPLNLALKQVHGNGSRVIAVFEDPNCGYCRTLRSDLNKLDNATIYTFAIPILAADSEIKARKALCAPDKVKAWNDLMLTGKAPDNPGTCSTKQMEQLVSLGQKLGVSVTPTLFFPNGRRVRGYVPAPELERMLGAFAKTASATPSAR